MDKQAYEDYIDRFLHINEDEHDPDLDQAKLAKDMLALKMKHEKGDGNPLLDEA